MFWHIIIYYYILWQYYAIYYTLGLLFLYYLFFDHMGALLGPGPGPWAFGPWAWTMGPFGPGLDHGPMGHGPGPWAHNIMGRARTMGPYIFFYGLASMRPSSQEAYASSGPKMLAAPAVAQPPQVPPRCRSPVWPPPALVVVALLLVLRASLAQRRHMLLEMRVSWMLIFLR